MENTSTLDQVMAQTQVRAKSGAVRQKEVQLLKMVKSMQVGRPSKEAMIAEVRKRNGMTRAQAKKLIKGFDQYALQQAVGQLQNLNLATAELQPQQHNVLAPLISGTPVVMG